MWHEARKNEKKIRHMMVDLKKRAERRKSFYAKIRSDPVQFLQVHGFRMKIHIDSAISQVAENCLMPWRGDTTNMIDRFDVRAHLDVIPTTGTIKKASNCGEESSINYERWRTLVQNEYLNVSEEKHLHRIFLKEKYGTNQSSDTKGRKKELSEKKASIGYNYDDPGSSQVMSSKNDNSTQSSSEESDSDDDDNDTLVDIQSMSGDQILKANSISHKFGVKNDDFTKYLEEDRIETERMNQAKLAEQERSMYSGRKSRKERRVLREKRLVILRSTQTQPDVDDKTSAKRVSETSESDESDSDREEPKLEFITSFGGSSGDEKSGINQKINKKKADGNNWIKKSSKPDKKEVKMVFGPCLPDDSSDDDNHDDVKFRSHKSFGQKNSYRRKSRSRSRERHKRDSSRDRYRDRRRRDSRSPYQNRDRSRSRDINRGRDRDRKRHDEKKRSRSRERRHERSRSRSRDIKKIRRSRSRSCSVDSFGRSKDKRKTITSKSPERLKVTPQVSLDEIEMPKAEPVIEVKVEVPPPPIKRYYRHDLAKSDSDDNDDDDDVKSQPNKISSVDGGNQSSSHPNQESETIAINKNSIEATPGLKGSLLTSCTPSSRPGTSSSSTSGRKHRFLMKKTRDQIETRYEMDKRAQEKKEKEVEKHHPHHHNFRSKDDGSNGSSYGRSNYYRNSGSSRYDRESSRRHDRRKSRSRSSSASS